MKKGFKIISLLEGFVLMFGIMLFNTTKAYADTSSIDDIFVSSSDYEETMNTVVEPYINNVKETGYMDVGEENFDIYYEKYVVPNSKASIVISHGFTESLEKYDEMIYYFMNEGYSVYGLEHRGHGRSGHLGLKDDTQVSVDSFDDYVSDLKQFLDEIVKPEIGDQKLFLFAHSMGGGIGVRFLEEYTNYFDAAILSAPMIEINTGNVPGPIAKLVSDVNITLSFGDEYVMGQGAYSSDYDFEDAATTCEERYAYYYNILNENTELQRGGASYKWLQTTLDATAKMVLPTEAAKVTIPVLLFQAGNDDYVKPTGQQIFKTFAKDCEIVKEEDSKHEIYREQDEILKPYLENVMSFYNKNL